MIGENYRKGEDKVLWKIRTVVDELFCSIVDSNGTPSQSTRRLTKQEREKQRSCFGLANSSGQDKTLQLMFSGEERRSHL